MNLARRLRPLYAPATDNWLSRAYLALVGAAVAFVVFDTVFVSHPDASMAGVVPWLLTAPLSLLLTLLPDAVLDGAGSFLVLYVVGIAVSAFVNAAVLGACLHRLRPTPPRTAHNA
ncbi:SCO4225 family membrane protein [Streptomyces sp. NPDC051677]|uniref:SCO4225 family membrane protein n=1 Tax=Streptomyces sp. NPDC051677 TaxID=3365669 RepID=UPI0037D90E12